MSALNKPKQEFSKIFTEINEIIASLKTIQYNYMDEKEYESLQELNESQFIYWSEIIQRTHFCGITSLQRVSKWMTSMNDSWNSNNYYGFCSSIRGLIEACSDSYYTISKIIDPVAEKLYLIEQALNLEAKVLLLSEEVENELIHYMYGRKLKGPEKNENPQSHQTLQVTQYLNHIGDDDIKTLYSELCQVSHPSMMSFAPFTHSDEEYKFILHNQDIDSILNETLLNRYRTKILLAINFAVVPSIALLKIINMLNAESMNSLKFEDKLLNYIIKSDFWKSLEIKINNSRIIDN